jgi:diguanylate cyclase (GGDEF)-like protein
MSSSESPPKSARRSAAEPARTVLVVDDDDDLRTMTVQWLTRAGLACIEASDGEACIDTVKKSARAIDAIVLDVMMPGMDGFEAAARLKRDPETAAIPIVLLTAHANEEGDIVRGVETGAVDHIAKPFSGPVLVAKVRALCERTRADRELRDKLRYAEENATIDPLTRLSNRRHFEARLKEESAHARRHQQAFSLLMLDIDHFKSVNDTFGHEEGDRVIVHVADAMRSILRKEDAAFRYGGEEFVILLRATDGPHALRAAERLRESLKARPIELGEERVTRAITFSGGVASVDASNAFATDDLVARADAALYAAKRGGRDRVLLAESVPAVKP